MILGIVLAAAMSSPSPSPTPLSEVTWNGVTLGTPSAALRSSLGDPVRKSMAGANVDMACYWIPGTKASYFLVLEQNGYVFGFMGFNDSGDAPEGVPNDPSGVAIGDSVESVKAKHPDFVISLDGRSTPKLVGKIADIHIEYNVSGGHVNDFKWMLRPDPSLAPLLPIADPDGSSFATAILDQQRDEMNGTSWEYRYVAFHSCSDGVRWQVKSQSLAHNDGRPFDILHVVCPSTNAERDFYFDITSYFGKF